MRTGSIFKRWSVLIVAITLLQSCSFFENETGVLLRKVRILESDGRLSEAEKIYEKLDILNATASPMQVYILLSEARLFLTMKNYKKTILTCEKGLSVCQSVFGVNDVLNTSFLFVMGSAYDESKDYDTATDIYKSIFRFVKDSPCSVDLVALLPVLKLGDIEFRNNHLSEALKFYHRANAIARVSEIMGKLTAYRLGICYLALGNNFMAEHFLRQALPMRSTQAAPYSVYYNFARHVIKEGRFGTSALAMRNFEVWSRRHKEYVDWYYARTNPASRCRIIDKATEQDFLRVDSIAEASKKVGTSERAK